MIEWLYNQLYYNNPCYKAVFGYSFKFWKGISRDLDVVNLGSNTGLCGFRYEGLPVKAANWALGPQSLNQDLMILKTYSSFIRHKGAILAPLCPYSSCFKNYTGTEWLKYYTFVHPGVIEDYSLEQQKLAYAWKEHPFRQALKPMLRGVVQAVKDRMRGVEDLLDINLQPLEGDALERDAQSFIDGWKRQFKIDDMDAPLQSHILDGRRKRIATLTELVSFCRDRDFRLFVILPPVTTALARRFSATFRENYIYSFVRECGIGNDMFLDYLDDTEFTDSSLFANSLILNKRGGNLFTKRVLNDIGLL